MSSAGQAPRTLRYARPDSPPRGRSQSSTARRRPQQRSGRVASGSTPRTPPASRVRPRFRPRVRPGGRGSGRVTGRSWSRRQRLQAASSPGARSAPGAGPRVPCSLPPRGAHPRRVTVPSRRSRRRRRARRHCRQFRSTVGRKASRPGPPARRAPDSRDRRATRPRRSPPSAPPAATGPARRGARGRSCARTPGSPP